MLVTAEDVMKLLPTQVLPLSPDDEARLEALIANAEEHVRMAFMRAGRDFDAELAVVPWLKFAAAEAVREMVSAAVLVGGNAGVRSVSSATGQESDSVTYADVDSVSFGGVRLTDALLDLLGLRQRGARWRSRAPRRWPEAFRR